jgi:hypothetical protein
MLQRGRIVTFVALVSAALLQFTVVAGEPAAAQSSVTLPDLVVRVPTRFISIAVDPVTGHRMLHFSHITSDVGAGPFEIDPTYNSRTGVAHFSQAIYRSPSSGKWVFDHRSRLAAIGISHPPDDYDFPLTSFALRTPDGKTVKRSPKTDYCITGDYRLNGVPHTPNQTFIPASNCADPTLPLGWSVGWGDKYDQTDDGQPIDLHGVPNGRYVLRGIVDPQHVLHESRTSNDVTDTVLRIHNTSVTVTTQTHPRVPLPAVAITAPKAGSRVHGAVTVSAGVSAPGPARVRSVQFLLDGAPLGSRDTTAPYRTTWHTGASPEGTHYLSARVTDTHGIMNTARPSGARVSLHLGRLVVGRNIARTATTSVTTKKFGTSHRGELLLAFAGADGPDRPHGQRVTVHGAALSWTKLRRANRQPGDAEIWKARAKARLHGATVTARAATSGYLVRLNVVALVGATGTGATVERSSSSDSPHASYTATSAHSVGFAVGNDFDHATSPVPGSHQVLVNAALDTATGDAYWTQARTAGAKARGVHIALNDTAPTGDRTNFAAVEVLAGKAASATAAPTVTLVNPTGRQVLSGTVPVAAQVTGPAPIRAVTFRVDGHALPQPVTTAPFATQWATTATADGPHTLTARVVDDAGRVSTARTVVLVRNPAPPMTCFVVQRDVTVSGRGSVVTQPLRTAVADEVLLAMVSAGGPAGQQVRVHGAGLAWRLVGRANTQRGDAEVWAATVPRVTGNIRVHAVPAVGGYRQLLTVVALEGVDGVGAVTARSGRGDTAHARLGTTGPAASLVFAVGTSRGRPATGTPDLPVGQIFAGRAASGRRLFWSQYTNQATSPAGSPVTMTARAPGAWNLVAVEAVGDDE